MARSLFVSLSKTRTAAAAGNHHHALSLGPSSRLVPLRTQSNQPDTSSDIYDSSDPLLTKLEDAIHRIIVRRSAPDWLPFLPGSSYWVPPPKSQFYGVAQLVEQLANPLTPEQSMSTSSVRGWPSSDYFIKDSVLHQPEEEMALTSVKSSEDEEG